MKNVTVIMSTYNGSKNIVKQLDSIFKQQNVNVKLYVRDDASTDDTVYIIKKYMKSHDYDIVIEEGENLGFAKSFWQALYNCEKNDYYAFSDQDDIWKPNKLFKCIQAIGEKENIPQLAYCDMQRSDIYLNMLKEQVKIVPPEKLTRKYTLVKTFNYGAATVINYKAKELICRCWPQDIEVPHDMWFGLLCFWFGEVKYVDEKLYYWIRYKNSVTGEGTRLSGIKYRIEKSLKGKSYPNVSKELLECYSDLLTNEDKKFLEELCNYKNNFKYKIKLLFDKDFSRKNFVGTFMLKFGILMNWF